jgi:hypothetical protein
MGEMKNGHKTLLEETKVHLIDTVMDGKIQYTSKK